MRSSASAGDRRFDMVSIPYRSFTQNLLSVRSKKYSFEWQMHFDYIRSAWTIRLSAPSGASLVASIRMTMPVRRSRSGVPMTRVMKSVSAEIGGTALSPCVHVALTLWRWTPFVITPRQISHDASQH